MTSRDDHGFSANRNFSLKKLTKRKLWATLPFFSTADTRCCCSYSVALARGCKVSPDRFLDTQKAHALTVGSCAANLSELRLALINKIKRKIQNTLQTSCSWSVCTRGSWCQSARMHTGQPQRSQRLSFIFSNYIFTSYFVSKYHKFSTRPYPRVIERLQKNFREVSPSPSSHPAPYRET